MAQLFSGFFYSALDANGVPISGAKLYFYATGTTTPQDTFTTSSLSVAHTNPVVADSAGRFAAIYLDPDLTYRVDLKDAGDVAIGPPIDPISSGDLRDDLADPTIGASLIGFSHDQTYAAGTVGASLRNVIYVTDEPFGAVGDGVTDDTTAIQSAINHLSTGGAVVFPRGQYKISATLTVSVNNTELRFEAGASLQYATATMTGVEVSGDDCSITSGAINAPAVFNGVNEAITYAVVKVTGDGFKAEGFEINNVPKVGFWFYECNNGIVTECIIDGGTTEGFYDETNTVHFGIAIDPPGSGSQGGFRITNNFIQRCVQGAGSGSTGSASFEQAIVVEGNTFENCWNHGWYSSGVANGSVIDGNSFSGCQIPIAVSGYDHVVSNNSLIVQTTGSGAGSDNEITGISLRDPVRCVVTGNVIKGEGTSAGVVIGLEDLGGLDAANKVENNIVADNVITITNTSVAGVTAIRLLSTNSVSNNQVTNNVINAPMRSLDGMIVVQGGAGVSFDNRVSGNTLGILDTRGNGWAIKLTNCADSEVIGNKVSIEFDAGTARTLTLISLDSCTDSCVDANYLTCRAAFGTNITVRGIAEETAGTRNRAMGNKIRFDPAKLAGSTQFLVLTSGPFLLDHAGTGTPETAVVAGVGSIWRRTDGGAGTSLYVKESGSNNTGWIGK